MTGGIAPSNGFLFVPLVVEIVLFKSWNDLCRRAGFAARGIQVATVLAVGESLALLFARGPVGVVTFVGLVGYLITVLWRLRWLEPSQRLEWRVWLALHRHQRPSWLSHPRPLTVAIPALVSIGLIASTAFGAAFGMVAAFALAVFIRVPWRLALPGAVWAGIYAGVALVLVTLTNQIRWIAPDPEVNGGVASLLVQIQLVLGALPLSAVLVGAQIVAGWVGLRGIHVGARRSVVISVAALCGSLALDVYTLGSKTSDPRWPEIDQIAAIGALLIALNAVTDVMAQLSTERVTASLIERIDAEWVKWIVATVDPYHLPVWRQNDPFKGVLGLLTRSVLRDGESDVFLNALHELSARFEDVVPVTVRDGSVERRGPPEDIELALDSYLAEEMMPLIEQLASQKLGWAIDEIVKLRWHLEATSTEWHGNSGHRIDATAALRGRRHEAPDGIQLYRAAISACLRHSLDEQAEFAIIRSARYVLRALTKLPDPTGNREIDPHVMEHAAQRRETPSIDELSAGLEGYLHTAEGWADVAAEAKNRKALKAIAAGMEWLIERGLREADWRWALWLVRRVGVSSYSVAATGAKAGVLAYSVPDLDTATSHGSNEQVIVETFAQWVATSITETALILDWFECRKAAMLALDLFPTFPIQAAQIAGGLERVREQLSSRPERERANLRWAFEDDLTELKKNAIRLLASRLRAYVDRLEHRGQRANRKPSGRGSKSAEPRASSAPGSVKSRRGSQSSSGPIVPANDSTTPAV